MKRYILGITGASGAELSKRLLTCLSGLNCELHVAATENGAKVFQYETDISLPDCIRGLQNNPADIELHDDGDLFACIASGSYDIDCMIVAPCSMAALGKLANGTGGGLLVRAADVCLKERRRLVLSPRETPLSSIHLRNMLTLSECGAVIVPPFPMFYMKNTDIESLYDGIAGRILKSAGIENRLMQIWRNKER